MKKKKMGKKRTNEKEGKIWKELINTIILNLGSIN